MITMKCCNNSEQVQFENLVKEGCEYKSGGKNRHLHKLNSARFSFQKILAPDPIKCVAKY